MVTVEAFKSMHKEFADVADDVVQTHLNEAADDTDATVCGGQTDRVIRLKACHAIALSPFGAQAALADENGVTPYLKTLETLTGNLGLAHGVADDD